MSLIFCQTTLNDVPAFVITSRDIFESRRSLDGCFYGDLIPELSMPELMENFYEIVDDRPTRDDLEAIGLAYSEELEEFLNNDSGSDDA
jgi:hypothetical protein